MKMDENIIDRYTSLSSQLWSLMQNKYHLQDFSHDKRSSNESSVTHHVCHSFQYHLHVHLLSLVSIFLIDSSSRYSFHFMPFLSWFRGRKTRVRHNVNHWRESDPMTVLEILASQTVPPSLTIISCLMLRCLPLVFYSFEGYLTLSPKIRSCKRGVLLQPWNLYQSLDSIRKTFSREWDRNNLLIEMCVFIDLLPADSWTVSFILHHFHDIKQTKHSFCNSWLSFLRILKHIQRKKQTSCFTPYFDSLRNTLLTSCLTLSFYCFHIWK